jgi:hypothetical protein
MCVFVRWMLVLVCAVLVAVSSTAQQSAPSSSVVPSAMTNTDVIALVSAGLSDDLVIAKIHAANATDFDTSVDGLKSLKAANVSNAVIQAMIQPAPVPAAAPAAANPDDPNSPHPMGLYIQATGADGAKHLTRIEETTSKGMKTSGVLAHHFSGGIAKAHEQAVLDGSKAPVEVSETNPIFYAYIPENFAGGTITPRNFLLVKLDVKENSRVINTASLGFASFSTGSDEKSRQGFSSETVKPGIYKITLANPLAAGEYAFQQNSQVYYDFGIQPAR